MLKKIIAFGGIVLKHPAPTLISLFSFCYACLMINSKGSDFINLTLCFAVITFFSTISLRFFLDQLISKHSLAKHHWELLLIPLAVLFSILFFGPRYDLDTVTPVFLVNLVICSLISFLLLPMAPFKHVSTKFEYWSFSIHTLSSIITAIFFATVLCLSITLALFAVEKLFGLEIRDGYLYNLFAWALVFAPLYSLYLIQQNVTDQNHENISKTLFIKIFSEYIILPILALYLVILYIYGLKIAIIFELPDGMVSYLISAYTFLGFFCLVNMYGNGYQKSRKIPVNFQKMFGFSLIPLLILEFIAIGRRISDYGVTPSRYFILLLYGFIALVSVYLIVKKRANLKHIVGACCLLALLSLVGPWGYSAISFRSQSDRVEKLIARATFIPDSVTVPAVNNPQKPLLTEAEVDQLISHVRFLENFYGSKNTQYQLQHKFSIPKYEDSYDLKRHILFIENPQNSSYTRIHLNVLKTNQDSNGQNFIESIKGFDFVASINRGDQVNQHIATIDGGISCEISIDESGKMTLLIDKKAVETLNVDLLVKTFLIKHQAAIDSSTINNGDFVFPDPIFKNNHLELILKTVSGNKTDTEIKLYSVNFILKYKR